MKCFIGIDLGSTTTKAVVMDDDGAVLGRGITNSRHVQYLHQLRDLEDTCRRNGRGLRFAGQEKPLGEALGETFRQLREESEGIFAPGARRKSDFFRDIAGSRFMTLAEPLCREVGLSFDLMLNVYDKSIIEVENRPPEGAMQGQFLRALENALRARAPAAEADGRPMDAEAVVRPVHAALEIPLEEAYVVGAASWCVRLPFPMEHSCSEISCQGLGAHWMYEATRTVLDIGGQ